MRTTSKKNDTRHFYGFDWAHGIGTWWVESAGVTYPCGTVHVFDTREARDAWVQSEPYAGHEMRRSSVGSRLATTEMRRVAAQHMRYGDYVSDLSTAELISAYKRALQALR